ncbi:MAG: ADP-ribosyl-[dinitrogen reductase] hydrolase [Gammaproteobacteria bacterium]
MTDAASRIDKAVAAYVGLAVGDALGATVEFMTPVQVRAAYGVHQSIVGGGWLNLSPGQVTDDTTMALALGRAILKAGHVDAWTIADAFSDWMDAGPVDIGTTVRRGIVRYCHTGDPRAPSDPHAAGNGACMRVLPVALATLGHPDCEVRAAVRAQGHITHNNALSDAACDCVVAMVQQALEEAGREGVLAGPAARLVQDSPEFAFDGERRDHPGAYVVETLQAVLQALSATDDFESCLVDVVNRGGDADTTGAIAGMLSGALYGTDGIPTRWVRALDPSVHAACRRQAVKLIELARCGR